MNRRQRKRRRQFRKAIRISVYVFPLICIIVAGIGVVRAFTSPDRRQKPEEPKNIISDSRLTDGESLPDERGKEASGNGETADNETSMDPSGTPVNEDENAGEDAEVPDDNEEFSLDDLDNPEGFDERPAKNGFVLENEQIDLNGLDTTCLDWGSGGDNDEYNRPVGCLQYQEKYGMNNAYFIKDEPEKKVIYLTMDEGYEYGCTPRILDTLKEKNVHAVFFVTKPYAEKDPQLVQRMIDEGHEVGNHSVTHPANGLPSQDIETQTNEVMENHRYIKEQFGYDMHLFRYPAGKFSQQSAALVNNLGYRSVFWSFAYYDYDVENQPDPAESLQKIMSCLHPGAIYLLHAESETNTQILGDFIDQVRAQGYEFKVFE